MTNQFDEFIKVLEAFAKHKVNYILIGGVAVILHGMGRLTLDIDIFVEMASGNILKLRQALLSIFKDDSIEEITFDELNQYAVIRYGTPNGFYIDIMARLGENAIFADLEYEILDYQGTPIKVATLETLYNLKKDTIRPKDKIDAMFLKQLIKKRRNPGNNNADQQI